MRTIAVLLCFISGSAFAAGSAPAVNSDLGCTATGHDYHYTGSAMTCGVPTRPSSTVVTLGTTCTGGQIGQQYIVTDALLPAALAVVGGGGAVKIGVTCNGTNWIVQ